jgi:uncharacterized DUF497 family protein
MACDWDPLKRKNNLLKHGVDFALACRIFKGPTVEAEDTRRDWGETRMAAYGEAEGQVLFVVYTWRRGVRRLISARKAGADERRAYFNAIR